MGTRGAKDTGAAEEAGQALVADLAPLGDVTARKMFGGRGIFCDDVMFALIDTAGTVHLRADDETAEAMETAGSTRHSRMPYWTVPTTVADNDDLLLEWGRRALDVARAAKR